jgi:LacI family transcriptional regulator
VSRVLNDGRVSAETRSRVEAAMRKLGYAPNGMARGLVTRSTRLVGVVVSDVTNVFYPELLEAIAARLSSSELQMLLVNAAGVDDAGTAQLLIEKGVDAVIFTAALTSSQSVRELASRLPVVLANRELEAPVDCVVGDNVEGAARAAQHLLELGHRRIAVVAGHPQASTTISRTFGFGRVLDAANGAVSSSIIDGCFDYEIAYERVRHALAAPSRPTAVFCHNDLMAFAALNAARAESVRVPEELSVVGFDDVKLASWETFALTTVRQPIQDMATTAVDLVKSRLVDSTHSPRRVVYPCELVVRKTTAPAPA